jgi:hypothetical protein
MNRNVIYIKYCYRPIKGLSKINLNININFKSNVDIMFHSSLWKLAVNNSLIGYSYIVTILL